MSKLSVTSTVRFFMKSTSSKWTIDEVPRGTIKIINNDGDVFYSVTGNDTEALQSSTGRFQLQLPSGATKRVGVSCTPAVLTGRGTHYLVRIWNKRETRRKKRRPRVHRAVIDTRPTYLSIGDITADKPNEPSGCHQSRGPPGLQIRGASGFVPAKLSKRVLVSCTTPGFLIEVNPHLVVRYAVNVDTATEVDALANRPCDGVVHMAQSVPPGDIATQPGTKIVFNAPYDDKHSYHIKVTNSSDRRIGWAFKTTNMKRLVVDPSVGVLGPKEDALIAQNYCPSPLRYISFLHNPKSNKCIR